MEVSNIFLSYGTYNTSAGGLRGLLSNAIGAMIVLQGTKIAIFLKTVFSEAGT